MKFLNKHIFIFLSIGFIVYAQMIMKWQINIEQIRINNLISFELFVNTFILNFWMLSSFIAFGISAICWLVAIKRFDLSYAFPFTSLIFVLIFIFSFIFFKEEISINKIFGLVLIISGIYFINRKEKNKNSDIRNKS